MVFVMSDRRDDVARLVAAVASSGEYPDVTSEVLRLMGIVRQVEWYFETVVDHADTRLFSKRLLDVRRVKTSSEATGEALPGKAKLVLEPDPDSDEPETIETEWLNNVWALRVATIAKANIGQRVTVWKHNTEPDAQAPQGYRRAVWVSGPLWPQVWPSLDRDEAVDRAEANLPKPEYADDDPERPF